MSRSLNKVQLIGNLGRDAETKFTGNGTAVTNFSVATERRWKDGQSGEYKSETDWHNVTLWKADKLASYLVKGTKLYVEGRLQTRKYDKDGQTHYATDVIAEQVILLGGKGGEDRESQEPVSRPCSSASAAKAVVGASGFNDRTYDPTDDDVPF